MNRFYKNYHKESVNQPPGTLKKPPIMEDQSYSINVLRYNEKECNESVYEVLDKNKIPIDNDFVTWIRIEGMSNTEELKSIGKQYDIHPLILEDILNPDQRVKIEEFKDHICFFIKGIKFNFEKEKIASNQLSLLLFDNYLITFQHKEFSQFNPVIERIKNNLGIIRIQKADYLLYSLFDVIVDSYFVNLEQIGEKIEEMEEELIENPTKDLLNNIQQYKRQMILFRRAIWPLREMLNAILRGTYGKFSQNTLIYFRDLYDHTIQIMETIENFRELLSSMLDIYLSSVNNKMNEVMKILTIISTIFIPITFIAGIYGMNFKYMPELDSIIAYPIVWIIILLIAIGFTIYFKKKRWF